MFKYKSGFSDRRHIFSTFRWVVRPEVYEELNENAARWNAANGMEPTSPGYFPAYRCPTRSREEASPAVD